MRATKKYQIMIYVAKKENAAKLMEYATRIARGKDAEILVLSMATVPELTPPSEAARFASEKEEAIREALKHADEEIPVHSIIKLGHNVTRGIVSALEEQCSNMIILGWRGRLSRRASIVERSPCDSIVIKLDTVEKPTRILVPIADTPHSMMAAEIARILAEEFDSEITILHILKKKETEDDAQKLVEPVLDLLREGVVTASHAEERKNFSQKIVEKNGGVADLIIEESEKHDLVIMGATRRRLLEQLLFGSIPEKVARKCNKTVMMVKRTFQFGHGEDSGSELSSCKGDGYVHFVQPGLLRFARNLRLRERLQKLANKVIIWKQCADFRYRPNQRLGDL